ncbi:hypothetical protein ASPCAL13769 [Aspergillus calidoustus]|uniref:Zn(2)-C6 fungal-type domain-containing protein n=1 Tax=Aspergillus calidoustus TaxID=454130 RepID=A0A0U5GHJ4_ASPCI|nr:hypothetical protein ASPCAL13769 [Aspergillus calidoustus]
MARRAHTKSRTGCRTCKIRRIRCDETWPSCKRCTSTGRRCDGPSPSTTKPPADSHPITVSFAETLTIRSILQMRVPQKPWDASFEETRYMQYFIERITQGPEIGHGTPTTTSSPTNIELATGADWRPLMIQAMHRELAVRQCVIALSALIQERVAHGSLGIHGFNPGPRNQRYVFALRTYGRALSSLQELVEDAVASSDGGNCGGREIASIESALLAGIVCIWFEVIMRDFRAGLGHLERCLRIMFHSGSDGKDAINPAIKRAYMKMDMQAAQYMGRRAPITASIAAASSTSTAPHLPYIFDTLDEAETCLVHEHARILHFARTSASTYKYYSPGNVPLDLIAQTHTFHSRLALWKSAFTYSYSCQKARHSSPRISARAALILIQYYIALITAATCLYAEEMLYDRFVPEFKRIVALARSACSAAEDAGAHTTPLIGLPISTGTIHPLYFAATKCRDASLRDEAITLLSEIAACPDGVWEGCILAAVAQRAREVEETSAAGCRPIPEFCRIYVIGLDIRRDVGTVVVDFRKRGNGMDGEWEEWVEELCW